MPKPKPKPMPKPSPSPSLLSELDQLFKQALPLIEDAYAFSQILGNILKAANQGNGPPPTYYIGETPDDATQASQQPQPTPPSLGTPVASFGDQAGGLKLGGNGYQIYIGKSAQPIATVAGTYASWAPVINGVPTLGAGPMGQPIAGEGSTTAVGPITDLYDDGVYMGANPAAYDAPVKHKLYTVAGTGAGNMQDTGYPAQCAQDPSVADYYEWWQVDYPADTFPMGPSVQKGIADLVNKITSNQGTFAMIGYSQGAVVTCKVWRDHILDPNGDLHDRINDFIGHVTFGNPLRCPGIANGNGLVPIPIPGNVDGYLTGGIAGPDDLTPWQTMPQHMDFAHDGDLYADCPTGPDPWANEAPPGKLETSIYKMVMGDITGPDGLLYEIGELLTNPIGELVPLIEAIINGLQFLADNQAPHQDYTNCMPAAVNYLSNRGAQVPARNF